MILSAIWFYYEMFREMSALRLVMTSSLYFHKARALRHTSALLRYNACSLRHRYERAKFTIHFIKEIKNLVPRALLSYKHLGIFKNTRASLHFSHVLKNSRVLILLNNALGAFFISSISTSKFFKDSEIAGARRAPAIAHNTCARCL